MKKFLSMLLMAAGLMSCGDDDKPFIPELNKLTSVTCTKNGNAFFNANITYDQDKQINRIILNTEGNQFTDNYIIVDKTISVSGVKMIDGSPTNPFVHTVYTLSGNMIAAKEEKSENKYMSNAVYTAVENRYTYSSNWLKSVSQIIQWPNEDGSGYQIRELGEVDRYSWENGNAVHYAYLPQKEITYEYNSQLRPENFPFRVVNSFQPVYNRQNEKYEFSKRKVQEETFEYSLNEVRTSLFHSVILYPFERSHIEFKQDIFTTFN